MTRYSHPTLEAAITERISDDVALDGDPSTARSVASILVPVAGGPHSEAAIAVADALADVTGAWIELLHVVPADRNRDRDHVRALLEDGREKLEAAPDVDTRILEAEDVVEEIVEQTRCYDVTVIGAPRKGRLKRLVFGSTATDIQSGAENTVLMARCREADRRKGVIDPAVV